MTAGEESVKPTITVIAQEDVRQIIDWLLEDRDELESLVAIGRNDKGEIYFYDTGGDIIDDLGSLEYLREHLLRRNRGNPAADLPSGDPQANPTGKIMEGPRPGPNK